MDRARSWRPFPLLCMSYINTLYNLWICMFLISSHGFMFSYGPAYMFITLYINLLPGSHSAPVPYPTVRRFVTEKCTCAHLCCGMVFCGMLLWCTVGFVSLLPWADRSVRVGYSRKLMGALSSRQVRCFPCINVFALYIFCTHSRILALLANVFCLSYDFK